MYTLFLLRKTRLSGVVSKTDDGQMKNLKLHILLPTYNDWECLELLIQRILNVLGGKVDDLSIYIINDCSTISPPLEKYNRYHNVHMIDLTHNIGHQKAIAIGLSYLAMEKTGDAVIVMDADGEDRPEDLIHLIETYLMDTSRILFAKRKRRKKNLFFRLCYFLYKCIFILLTGESITFGNFCVIPYPVLKKLVHVSEIWNHFSGGVIKSKLPYRCKPIDRGDRISGKSKMNFVSLIIHGISSFSVYLDVLSIRLMIFCALLIGFSIIASLLVISIRLFTDLAIPGWATYSMLALMIIFIQAFFISIILGFAVTFFRTYKVFIPAIHYKNYLPSNEQR